eukprot:5659998-Pleurochrysis_carterae.AAC.1
MTNWASLALPPCSSWRLIGNAREQLAARRTVAISRRSRAEEFHRFILTCQPGACAQSESCKLGERPCPTNTLPPTHQKLHEPSWDRLQSSYDDVEAELELIRKDPLHSGSSVLFIGCGGAGYSRMIDRLSHNPQRYLMTELVVVP